MSDLRRFAGRFLVPLALLAAAIGAWALATQLASTEPAASGASDPGLGVTLSSVRRLPTFVSESSEADGIAAALSNLPADPGGLSCTAIYLDGQPVLQVRSDRALQPAYAQLLITGHAAMQVLGADHQFETQLFADALPDVNGRLFNGVYLIGGGDPGLMTSNYSLSFRPARTTRTPIEDLAAGVPDAGVVRIDGGIIAVERHFDAERSLPGWPEDLLTSGVIGPLSALQLDDGFIERPGSNLGVAVPAEDPALLAAEHFADLLRLLDVQVFGEIRALRPDEPLPELVPVARIFSPPLGEIVFQTLAVNDATAAELLLKEIGLVSSAQGSTQAGGRAVQQLIRDQGVDVAVPFRDGSGLDPFGGTSCDQLAAAADTIPDGHPTLEVLPAYDLPGVFDGALTDIDLESDLRLVGGTHDQASGLVGRTVDQGRRVSIASIINRPGGPTSEDLAYQRGVVELVDALRVSISVEALAVDD